MGAWPYLETADHILHAGDVVDPALLDELKALGPTLYRQEFLCEFVADDEAVFPTAMIEAAFTDEIRPLWS